jgi:hydroxymethylglutaryl-CoA lyase
MAFGNPYEDEWNAEIAIRWSKKLSDMGVEILALSDTIGAANPNDIEYLFKSLIPELPSVEFGAHLHSTPQTVDSKLAAAINAGCKRIDGAIKGYGGCPMAKNDLTGNMPTEIMKSYLEGNRLNLGLNDNAFAESLAMVNGVFPQ